MKKYKIYVKGNYLVVVDTQKNEYFYGIRKEVHVDKSNANTPSYKIFNVKDFSSNIILSVPNILKEDGTAYSEAEFDTFYQENTGNFNGGGTAPTGDFLSNDETSYIDATLPLAGTELALVEQGGTFKKVEVNDLASNKLDKVTTNDVEKVYIKNADGTQGMKPVSEFGGGGSVQSVTGDSVDNTDTLNPIINAIPLSGTTVGNPVSGNIEIVGAGADLRIFSMGDSDILQNNIVFGDGVFSFGVNNLIDGGGSSIRVIENYIEVIAQNDSVGIKGSEDFTSNITDLDYVQKKYVDTKVPKVTTSGVERAYIINSDGSQSTKPTSEFGTVKGTGTINRISKFTAGGTIGDSQIFDNGTNVGIGTTSPTTVLDVQGNYSFNTGTARPLKIAVNSITTTVADFGTGMVFGLKIGSGSVEDVAYIDVINTETFRSGEISFKVSQGSSPVEAMRINYVGNVGIGTTSPQARLDVRAQGVLATDIVLRVRNSTDTQNFLVVNGAGDVYNNGAKGVNTNTFFGENVGRNATGSNNTAFGESALRANTTGYSNAAIGVGALRTNTTGNSNTAFGQNALRTNTKGDYNTAIGVSALGNNTTGFNNAAIGSGAGRLISDGSGNTITNNSIFIGFETRALADNNDNQIVIGYRAIGLGSDSVVLGNNFIRRTQLRGQVIMGAFSYAPTGIEGAIYYDSTTKKHRGFNGTAWNDLY